MKPTERCRIRFAPGNFAAEFPGQIDHSISVLLVQFAFQDAGGTQHVVDVHVRDLALLDLVPTRTHRQEANVKPQPLIAVQDVARASAWYQRVLGCLSAHGGHEYDQLVDREGRLILQLHHWDAHAHPYLGDPKSLPYGNGVLIWFEVDDFRATVRRVQALSADVLEGPKLNPDAQHLELWLRDLDGYVVVVASAQGEV